MRVLTSVLVGVLGVLAFALATTSATASTIRVNNSSFTGVVARTITFDPGGLSIRCDRTLALGVSSTSFTAASLPAVIARFGAVTARAGSCDGGHVLTLLGMPWAMEANVSGGPGNVTGTTRVVIKDVQFERANAAGTFRCLYRGDLASSLNAAGTTATVNANLPLVSGSILCPSPGILAGTIALSPAAVLTLS